MEQNERRVCPSLLPFVKMLLALILPFLPWYENSVFEQVDGPAVRLILLISFFRFSRGF